MVKEGTQIIKGVEVNVSEINKVTSPSPTTSDKEGDLLQKIRYLIDLLDKSKDSALFSSTDAKSAYDQLKSILGQLDITISALRDALRGTGNKTLTDLETDLSDILAKLDTTLSTRASETTLFSLEGKIQSQSAGIFVKDVSVGTTAVPLDADTTYRHSITLLADENNTDVVKIGDSSNQLFPLKAGAAITIRKTSLNLIYAVAANGTQTIHLIAGGS